MAVIGRDALVVSRLTAAAADPSADALFVAKAALKGAIAIRRDAELLTSVAAVV